MPHAGTLGHRQRALTPARRKLLLEAIEKGHSPTAASSIAGISRRTLQRELQRSAVLARQVDAARDKAESYLLEKVIEAAAKDARHAEWLLERRWAETYGRNAAQAIPPEQVAALALAERVARLTPDEQRATFERNLRLIREHDEDTGTTKAG
jgi:hypothetical protein